MGTYISKPITEKESLDEDYKHLKCGSSSMQGWRTAQEDALNAILNFDDDVALFGVYDGHGGPEVAEFVATYFPKHLQNNESYKLKNFEKALQESFLEFDAKILEPSSLLELKKIATAKKDAGKAECDSTDSEEDIEEVIALRRDASMPIDEVIATNYSDPPRITDSSNQSLSPALRPKRTVGNEENSSIKLDLDDGTSSSSESSSKETSLPDTSTTNDKQPSDNSSLGSSNNSSDSSNSSSTSDNSGDKTESESSVPNGDKESDSGKATVVNGKMEHEDETKKSSSDSKVNEEESKPKVNGEIGKDESHKNGHANGEETNGVVCEELVVKGKRITPIPVKDDGSVGGYTGKGKSGGKGGKVKGASAITTKTVQVEKEEGSDMQAKKTLPARTKKTSIAEAKKNVLSEEDLDSEEDDDESFAVEGADEEDLDDDEEEDEEEDDEDEEEDLVGEDNDYEEEEEDDDELEVDPEDAKVYNEFYTNMREEPGFDSGCTACVALLHKHTLYVANVGDSRCVVSRAGTAIDMSIDHKPEDDIETQRIVNAGGRVTKDGRVNGGLNLSRALGDHGYKQNDSLPPEEQMISPMPDIKALPLRQDDDFIIIACDGIWNSLTSQQAVDFVIEHQTKHPDAPLSSACEALFDYCLAPDLLGDGTGCDNMTCIIVSFKDKTMFAAAEDSTASEHLLDIMTKSSSVNGTKTKDSVEDAEERGTKREVSSAATDEDDDRPASKRPKVDEESSSPPTSQ